MTITTLNENAEYTDRLPEWTVTRKALKGAKSVKGAGEALLPMPNPTDKSPENLARYEQYKLRAQFVNFTARSARGFVGLVRQREPIVELPDAMEYLVDSATSSGVGLNQLADDTVRELLTTGRYGYLADYPEQASNLSSLQTELLGNKGRILTYKAEQIPMWHESIIDGMRVLDYVKLIEPIEKINANGDTIEATYQYRVLRLTPQIMVDEVGNVLLDDNGDEQLTNPIYTQAIYEDEGTTKLVGDIMTPMYDGTPFDFIPFIFVGSESNDPQVDPAPLYDIADINIGHYRNSADYEESAFVVGQPMLGIVTDISPSLWADANPNFSFGCRAGVFLGANGDLKLVQAQPNTLAKEAMDSKENQLKMIGAKIIEQKSSAETATAARITNGAENSVLGKIVLNTSDAIVTAIGWIGLFQGVITEDAVVYELNTKFYEPGVDPQAIVAAIAMYDRKLIAKPDVQDFARKQGVVESSRTNEDIDKDAVDNDMEQL